MSTKRKNYIVLSTYVDSLLQEQMPDIGIKLFTNLSDLADYVDRNPLRADSLFITREIFEPTVNSRIALLLQLLGNPFLKVDTVEYLTLPNSEELISLDFILQDKGITNWNIYQTELTREKISGLISGSLKSDDVEPKRKAVYRVRRDEFIKRGLEGNEDEMNLPFESEEEFLKDIPDERQEMSIPSQVAPVCQIHTITGLPNVERTMFCFLMAQYLSHTDKTIIIEKDFEYLRLTEIAKKAGVPYMGITVQELYEDTLETINKIRNTNKKLIVINCYTKSDYDYNFICTLLYANLKNDVTHLVKETEIFEVSESSKYIVCFKNTVIDIIKTCEQLPNNYTSSAKFAALSTTKIKEMTVPNSKVLGALISDLLQMPEPEVPIFEIKSLRGGNTSGLRMLT